MRKSKIIIAAVIVAVMAAGLVFALTACGAKTNVVLQLNGGTYEGSADNITISTRVGKELDMTKYSPVKTQQQLYGWVDSEGNFYASNARITVSENLTLTAQYKGILVYTVKEDGTFRVSASENFIDENVVIPSEHDSVKVTEIAENAFAGCTSIKTMTVPDSVTKIGKGAFKDCSSMHSLTLPFAGASASVTDGSTQGIGYLFGVTGGSWGTKIPASLTTVTISDAATSIPVSAFEECINIKVVNLGKNITSIGMSAFRNCTALETVTLPEACTSVGPYAFNMCTKAKITVQGTLTSVGTSAFANTKLSSVKLGNSESMKTIPASAFANTQLTEITIPSGVSGIDQYAFSGCTKLVKVNINSEVTLNSGAFNGCTLLTDASFGTGIDYIRFADGVSGDNTVSGSAFYRTGVTYFKIDKE